MLEFLDSRPEGQKVILLGIIEEEPTRTFPQVKEVIHRPKHNETIMLFKDGSKTVAKCNPDEEYSEFIGETMCLLKYLMGSPSNQELQKYYDYVAGKRK